MYTLQSIWFGLIIFLLTVYAVLDGFDLGAGILYLFSGEEKKRRIISAVGPFWDGNEVWLLTGGGATFAAFPNAYAAILSTLYAPVIAVLLALGLRAVSIEFRNKIENSAWRAFFGAVFSLSSLCSAFAMGLIVGNVVLGPSQDIYNTTAIVFGVAAVALFILHGAAFLSDKKAPFILTSVAIIASAIVLSIISFPESFGTTSSYLTLKTMLILALIGMPFVVAYTVWAYVVLKRPAKNSLY